MATADFGAQERKFPTDATIITEAPKDSHYVTLVGAKLVTEANGKQIPNMETSADINNYREKLAPFLSIAEPIPDQT